MNVESATREEKAAKGSVVSVEDGYGVSMQRRQALEAEKDELNNIFSLGGLLHFNEEGNEEEEGFVSQNHWIFHFMDIIYVATIYNISHLLSYCGENYRVYMIAGAYFAIMFTSRMLFDTYTSIMHANGILHTINFIFYGVGIYIMTLNIAVVPVDNSSAPHAPATDYGVCQKIADYDYSFAAAFLFTRLLLFVLFGLYGRSLFLEEGDAHGTAGHGGQDRPISSKRSSAPISVTGGSSALASPISSTGGSTPQHQHNDSSWPAQQQQQQQDKNATTTTTTSTTHTAHIGNTTTQAEEHRAHLWKVYMFRILPLMISSVVMFSIFGDYSPVIILSLVAAVEMLGDILPQLVTNMEGLFPDRHHLEERLGLLFMLVLGETMLGFLVQRYNLSRPTNTYSTLIASYFLVITLGMQYFQNAQFPYLPHGQHPLDQPIFNACFVWLNAALSFVMLITANGMINMYYIIAQFSHGPASRTYVQQQMLKISVGLFLVWILMLLLQFLEGTYRRKTIHSLRKNLLKLTGQYVKPKNSAKGDDGHATSTGTATGASSSAAATTTETMPNAASKLEEDDDDHDVYHHLPRSLLVRTLTSSSLHSTGTSTSNSTTAGGYSGHVNTPTLFKGQVFNKRILLLKLGVALVHLFSYRYGLIPEHFVLVNAIVAVIPNLAEIVLDMVDLRQRLLHVKQQLNIQLTREALALSLPAAASAPAAHNHTHTPSGRNTFDNKDTAVFMDRSGDNAGSNTAAGTGTGTSSLSRRGHHNNTSSSSGSSSSSSSSAAGKNEYGHSSTSITMSPLVGNAEKQ